MTRAQFEQVGVALYGAQWQSDLARALKCDARKVRHWQGGTRPIPQEIAESLRALMRNKAESLRALAKSI